VAYPELFDRGYVACSSIANNFINLYGERGKKRGAEVAEIEKPKASRGMERGCPQPESGGAS